MINALTTPTALTPPPPPPPPAPLKILHVHCKQQVREAASQQSCHVFIIIIAKRLKTRGYWLWVATCKSLRTFPFSSSKWCHIRSCNNHLRLMCQRFSFLHDLPVSSSRLFSRTRCLCFTNCRAGKQVFKLPEEGAPFPYMDCVLTKVLTCFENRGYRIQCNQRYIGYSCIEKVLNYYIVHDRVSILLLTSIQSTT